MTAPALDLRYIPHALPDADAALAYLVDEVAWLDRMRARQTASFGLPYDYSGQHYDACAMPPVISAIAERAAELAGHAFNNCLCNRYETGANTMGYHHDSYEGLVAASTIAIASFGATRTLVFRSVDQQHRAAQILEHGSLLVMGPTSQRTWMHAVQRSPGAGRRISVTFRQLVTA